MSRGLGDVYKRQDTAYRFGLVDEIVEDEELIDRAHTLLSASLSANQNHVSSIKKLLS